MTAPSRTQAEHALAALINAIRPDWDTPGILARLREHPRADLRHLTASALWATSKTHMLTPALIGSEESMGAAWDRLTGASTAPSVIPACPYHPDVTGRGDCPKCAADRRQIAAPDQVRQYAAKIRQHIRENRHKEEA